MEGKEAMILQPKKCLCRCTQMGYVVGFVYQNAGAWVVMKLMEIELTSSFINFGRYAFE